jgi:hypothetical protein
MIHWLKLIAGLAVRWWRVAAGALVALAVVLARRQGRRDGRREAENDALRDAQTRVERGRQAVRDGRDGGKSADQRLRDNDGRW